jgi:aminopeptidase YwaD
LNRLPRNALLLSILAYTATYADERKIAFWPDTVPAAIHAAVDGQAALESVRTLGRFHRVHGSPGYAAAADWVRMQAQNAGLSEVQVEHFPADGSTRYHHFRSYLGWNGMTARLVEVSPKPHPIANFPELPVALADYSQDADVHAELVDVGPGTSAKDYVGRDVKGKIVLASGALTAVHKLAVEERGALGFLSDFPNQTTAWSGDDQDLVRWGHLSPYLTTNKFAFMLSKRQSREYRERLANGEQIKLHATVRAKMQAANFDVVSALIPGTDPLAGEVVLTAHLCHQSAGANDNASGSAAILEVARALNQAIADGRIAKPRHTIRFLWTPEIAGSQAWLSRHPDIAARIVGGIHMDMVGALLGTTHSTFHLSRSAATLPHIINEIGQTFFDEVVSASAQYAERGGDAYTGFVTPGASRDLFLGDVRPIELGSDHEVFQAAGWGVPMLYFHDWPDVTIHTNKDQVENLDATKLGRVSYLGAAIAYTLAALPEHEAPKLLLLAKASAEKHLAQARLFAALTEVAAESAEESGRDGKIKMRESLAQSIATYASVSKLWPGTAKKAAAFTQQLAANQVTVPAANRNDKRVPVRAAEVRGPLSVYYYNHLNEVLVQAAPKSATVSKVLSTQNVSPTSFTNVRGDPELMEYEALNLVDGKRSISEICDVLSGRYSTVPLDFVASYFVRLAAAGVLHWK